MQAEGESRLINGKMKKIGVAALLVCAIFIFWIVRSDVEFGTYDSLQEAMDKAVPYEIKTIIHTGTYGGVTAVMYTTDPDKKELPFADYEALAVAFFKVDEEKGWENIGGHSWTHYENENLTQYDEYLRDDDGQGNRLHELHVVFGEINNPDITKVETSVIGKESFEEAEIIENGGQRYYFDTGSRTVVRGLSAKGEVIDRQGG